MRSETRLLMLLAAVCLMTPLAADAKDATPPPADGEPCKGTIDIGGKTYELKYAVAYPVRVFDEDGISVLFSEQPIAIEKLKKTLIDSKGSDSGFFHFKPHVTVTFDKAGKAMFCNAWADNNSVSISGTSLAGEIKTKDGKVSGKTSLKADEDSSRKSRFDIAPFDLTLLAVPVAEMKSEEADKPKAEEAKKPAPAAVHYKDLPLPDGATNVEYKKLVGHIHCKSPGEVKTIAEAMTKKLAEQGWETKGSDAVSKSATLQRKRGDATLTIFVRQFDAKTTTLQIMSAGLDWDEKK